MRMTAILFFNFIRFSFKTMSHLNLYKICVVKTLFEHYSFNNNTL